MSNQNRMSPKRPTIVAIAVAGALLVLAVGAYAYDSARDDMIAKGVSVAGVDVGGMRASKARVVLREKLLSRLERPVRVAVAGRRYRLTANRAHLIGDIDGMVAAAVDESRSGGLPKRVWRDLTSSRVRADVAPQVNYSTIAVNRFVRTVKRSVDRPARDADLRFQAAALPAIPSQTGLRLNGARLRVAITDALTALGSQRLVRARVRVVKPKVTTGELGKKYPYVITVDRSGFRLRFFKRLRLAKTYKIAVGQIGLETPAGLYHVQNKAIDPAWHVPNSAWAGKLAGKVIPGGVPENPLKARWLGIYAGAGIHGTADIGSLGSAASHGCIRMSVPDVEELYDQVPVQTPVYIQ
jgi:lipoprotein-anchoring transpeptidase ErfK/SrfK